MSRLFRPHIPLKTRCIVALHQMGELFGSDFIEEYEKTGNAWGPLLDQLLVKLADILHADKLHLDHDPPLAARKRRFTQSGIKYEPDANDPNHLIYREAHAHKIKTLVRGEHGQYPDRVLIKRARKRDKPKSKFRMRSRPIPARVNPWPKGRRLGSHQ